MSKKYLIGHTKPDTDAVVSALAFQKLFQAEECFCNQNAEVVIADPLNPETSYLFNRFELTPPPVLSSTDIQSDDQFILVDHNEESQRHPGINSDQIVEIFDHHKLNLNLKHPLYVTIKPWGSSTTIAAFLLKQYQVTPDQTLASLMLAAILSDTVGFKSATTTDHDRKYAEYLAEIAGIDDVAGFTLDIFKAKSDISSLTAKQIVLNDYKIFEFGTKKVLIDQLETVEQARILSEKKTELLTAMKEIKTEQAVDLLFVAITDILQVNTQLLLLSETETAIAEAAFGGTASQQILDIGPKLSRKKEIAPEIEKACLA